MVVMDGGIKMICKAVAVVVMVGGGGVFGYDLQVELCDGGVTKYEHNSKL
ncbi:hypothetical protein JBE27_56710 [Streptomyces albiflaviniger]|nr:hypothetical protein [Streptomyces albiflaviniger]